VGGSLLVNIQYLVNPKCYKKARMLKPKNCITLPVIGRYSLFVIKYRVKLINYSNLLLVLNIKKLDKMLINYFSLGFYNV